MGVRYETVIPDPKRVIEGLRDTGYQIESAIEDIIDNSIAADASIVDVNIQMDYDGNILVYILDNGQGMSKDDLTDAMRYGSKKRPDPSSLGKFGLGLKTASTAFCRKLSVISKDNNSQDFAKATWDLDHVALVGEWQLKFEDPAKEEIKYITSIIGDSPGTLVIWDKVDRLLKQYQEPGGKHAKASLKKIVENIKEHAGMVYQRFLDHTDKRAKNLEIKINGEKIKPWNPFIHGTYELVAHEEKVVEFEDGRKASFNINAYVLPRQEEFNSDVEKQNAKISNYQQGIYVYRENRLIFGPDWMRLYSKEPHFSLLRVEFSFNHKLDDVFQVDIKKSQVILNEELYDWLNKFLIAPRRAAEDRYRKGQKLKASVASEKMHDSSNNNIKDKENEISESEIKIVDKEKGLVDVTNKHGTSRLKIKITDERKPGELYIQPVPSIEDGLLWEPAIIGNKKGVRINTNHEYYSKVYMPNKTSGVIIQGLDSILWALCEAELSTVNAQTQKYFQEMRREVSRVLRTLVEDLPEAEE